jgi:hypothetical protein
MHRAKQALPDQAWPTGIGAQDWVVYAKPTLRHADAVLNYLGRYVHRVAITNHRLFSLDEVRVTFRYRKVDDAQLRTMNLSAHEFIRRFLQHVLPDGFHKVRYYGLWAPAQRHVLKRVQEELRPPEPAADSLESEEPVFENGGHHAQTHSEPLRCPECGEVTCTGWPEFRPTPVIRPMPDRRHHPSWAQPSSWDGWRSTPRARALIHGGRYVADHPRSPQSPVPVEPGTQSSNKRSPLSPAP